MCDLNRYCPFEEGDIVENINKDYPYSFGKRGVVLRCRDRDKDGIHLTYTTISTRHKTESAWKGWESLRMIKKAHSKKEDFEAPPDEKDYDAGYNDGARAIIEIMRKSAPMKAAKVLKLLEEGEL